MSKKPFRTVGGIVFVVAALAVWHYVLVSTRPPELKAWESCKAKIFQNWATSHADTEQLLQFTRNHFYSFGGESVTDHFDDHDSRDTAVADAAKLRISEGELIQLDRRIATDCGPFPRQK